MCGHLKFEQVIESRSATPKPVGNPRNDTGVITHALAARVKHWNRNSYHSVTRIRRVETSACLSHITLALLPERRRAGQPSVGQCGGHGSAGCAMPLGARPLRRRVTIG